MCRLGCLLPPGLLLGNLYFETVCEDDFEVLDMCMRVLHFHLQNISLFCRYSVSAPRLDVAAEKRGNSKQSKALVHASWFCTAMQPYTGKSFFKHCLDFTHWPGVGFLPMMGRRNYHLIT